VVPGAVLPVVAVIATPRLGCITFTTILLALLIPARSSRSLMVMWSQRRTPVMLLATSLRATWILLQMQDAVSSLSSLGLAKADSAWANLPMTST
jgi:hypothetical protein